MDVTFEMFTGVIVATVIYYAILAIANRKRANEE